MIRSRARLISALVLPVALASGCNAVETQEKAQEKAQPTVQGPALQRKCVKERVKPPAERGGESWEDVGGYCLAEIRGAQESALRKFEKKIAPRSSVQNIKVWDSGAAVSVAIQYSDSDDSESETRYFACHYHSETSVSLYCHFMSEPGPNEPDSPTLGTDSEELQ